jgi:hypothetical protein
MSATQAWAWLAQGGFAVDAIGQAGIGGYGLSTIHHLAKWFLEEDLKWQASDRNVFVLNLDGAQLISVPDYKNGRVVPVQCYVRGDRKLPVAGLYELFIECLKRASDIQSILQMVIATIKQQVSPAEQPAVLSYTMQVLEVMVAEGWVKASLDPNRPMLNLATPREGELVRTHVDLSAAATDGGSKSVDGSRNS